MKEITKKYSNGEVTVIWKPHVCQHSGKCYTGLPEVFDTKVHPWVNPMGADSQAIIAQVKMCPSKALTFEMNNAQDAKGKSEQDS